MGGGKTFLNADVADNDKIEFKRSWFLFEFTDACHLA